MGGSFEEERENESKIKHFGAQATEMSNKLQQRSKWLITKTPSKCFGHPLIKRSGSSFMQNPPVLFLGTLPVLCSWRLPALSLYLPNYSMQIAPNVKRKVKHLCREISEHCLTSPGWPVIIWSIIYFLMLWCAYISNDLGKEWQMTRAKPHPGDLCR